MLDRGMTRRDFLAKSTVGAASVALAGMGTFVPKRAFGANDRLSVGVIGLGGRGWGLVNEVRAGAEKYNCEVTAICDTWHPHRENIKTRMMEWPEGKEPRAFSNYEDMLALDDLDAVAIAPPDFAHAIMLRDTVRAGKHAFVEKPFATELNEANEALDACNQSNVIVQVGTQRRSEAMWRGAAEVIHSGVLGKIHRIEIAWNDSGPRWNKGNFDISESDVDWQRFLMNKPHRPFDKNQYREWQLYRDFTNGPIALLGVHFFDVVAWYTGDPYPYRAVTHGGKFVWNDHREHEDTITTVIEYPSGFLCEYTSMFGNSYGMGVRIYGTNGMFDDATWTITGTGGGTNKVAEDIKIDPAPAAEHHTHNWLRCIRSGETPNAPAESGHQHAIVNILTYQSLLKGRRLRYLPETRQIVNG
jgi:predicted dehydrogenase